MRVRRFAQRESCSDANVQASRAEGTATVAVVPEPSTGLLFAFGLMALAPAGGGAEHSGKPPEGYEPTAEEALANAAETYRGALLAPVEQVRRPRGILLDGGGVERRGKSEDLEEGPQARFTKRVTPA